MTTFCKYGYKVCYKELGKTKLKTYLVTNSLYSAIWHVRYYEQNPLPNIKKPKWVIQEIKTLKEYKWRWHGCPF